MTAGSDTIAYLYGLQYRGMKFGLRNMRALLKAVGNPERSFPSIHVAGTNGKGSTCSFLASIFTEAGYTVGLYTSPHLVRFTERIRIGPREIPEHRLREYTERLRPPIEKFRATFFEATTCIAFLYFADESVDLAVVETGLGGRLDATNVLLPMVSVITNIALDHTEYLGTTIRSVAREKGGIIKKGVPVVTGARDRVAVQTLRDIARNRHAKFIRTPLLPALDARSSRRRGALLVRTKRLGVLRIVPGLRGSYQAENAGLAIAVVDRLLAGRRSAGRFSRVGKSSVRRGLARVIRNSGLHGRLQKWGRKGHFILDVAHNPAGIRALVSVLKDSGERPVAAVFGVMKDKDRHSMLQELSRLVGLIVPVRPRTDRAVSVGILKRDARRSGLMTVGGGTVADGIKTVGRLLAATHSVGRKSILVTGSHYVVGEFMELAGRDKYA